jgi:hypothetical protein
MANPAGIDAAVADINKLGLGIILPPRHCSRVACRRDVGIWVCVDVRFRSFGNSMAPADKFEGST